MRPRLDCRGEPNPDALGTIDGGALQCGHGSIAVENAGIVVAGVNLAELQCGHGSIAVENRQSMDA